ncbi:Bug family tripartite tricarboxylate transporter substrate binding protein [Hydrogenophaga sp. OTU3427]|uniref:Bug family tripartite tricarboxylate transporter substrate binding protein n=1 Tax=Hydrogenophaga sp. OTU3427 TaxID=3043856 RepID=UPI00313C6774
MTTRRRHTLGLLAAALCAAHGATAWAQSPGWPQRAVRVVVPAAAGTAPDIMARLLGERLSRIWSQPVVVDNRPGAGGLVGMAAARNAPRDDHILVFSPASVLTLSPYMYKTTQVDIVKDFTAVALVGISPMVAAVSAGSSATSLADVIRAAKAQPDRFVISTTFQYSVPHLAVDMLSKAAGVPLRAVPYSNSGQSIAAVISGDAQMLIDGVPPIDPMVKGGRLKPVAIFSEERLPNRGQLPTASETYPSLVINGWFGFLAPTGASAQAMARVNSDLNAVVAQPDIVERMDAMGVYPRPLSQAQFADFLAKDRSRWEQVLRDVGAQPVAQ